MAIVFINELTVNACIGVFDWEKRIRQRLVFDIEMSWPNQAVAATDDINKALDYSEVAELVTVFAESRQFELIETLAEQAAELIMTQCGVKWLRLEIAKPGAIKNAAKVGIRIERGSLNG
ncbi:dihydroneopterin aldolase [Catenovulum sp. SM1970]|uniref:dihydroneopterin aldolase n=1 Tax=Marinifaba aquimaris TaxID=2741323 RepID=UPI0015716D8D|nr:dihydroneopterin aldolase [Marinifaba aquimaris]NTS78154.1 dihydroneopterin aldolase [Marinifaba aquimaris]